MREVFPALLVNSVASALVLLICAASVGWLIHLSVPGSATAIVVGLLLALLLLLAEILFTSMGGPHAHMGNDAILKWRPHPLHLFFFFLVALCFSQPALLVLQTLKDPERIVSVVAEEKARERLRNDAANATLASELEGRLRQDRELQVRLEALAKPGADAKPTIPQILDNKSSRRKALLIGNQTYRSVPALNNPVKDTTDLASALEAIGFKTTQLIDAGSAQMEQGIEKFVETLAPGDISLVYFSGHGFQERGVNFLVPVDFKAGEIESALGLNLLISKLNTRRLSANLLVIDACRSFLPGSGTQGGLASTEAGRNTYIALAAKPGQVAMDGSKGSNGFFTAALLKQLSIADTSTKVDEIFSNVVSEVGKRTNQSQEPWITHNLSSGLTLVAPNSPRREVRKQSRGPLDGILVDSKDEPGSCETRARSMPEPEQLKFLRQCVTARVTRQAETLSILKCGAQQPSFGANSSPQQSSRCSIDSIVTTDRTGSTLGAITTKADIQPAESNYVQSPSAGDSIASENKTRFAPSDFARFLRGLWLQDGATTLGYSLLITLVLLLPFAWRDLSLKMLRTYGMARNTEHRLLVQEAYNQLQDDIKISSQLKGYADKLLYSVSDANPEPPNIEKDKPGIPMGVEALGETTA